MNIFDQLVSDLVQKDPNWVKTVQGAKKEGQSIMYELDPNPSRANHFFGQIWYATALGVKVTIVGKGVVIPPPNAKKIDFSKIPLEGGKKKTK
jgi:hypothetical protein